MCWKIGIDIYYNMELERQFHPEFFDSSAPLATLNENCTFNIHSGKHRMVYQIVNGTLFLPLKLRKREYVLWRNEAVAHSIFRYLEENNIRSLAVPIMNPYFYKFPCDNMMFYYEMQKNIVNFIYRYFMKSCEDNNLIDKVKFAILSCLIIEQMNEYCKRNHILKTPQEIARIYSKEIEYSQETWKSFLKSYYWIDHYANICNRTIYLYNSSEKKQFKKIESEIL